MASQKPVPGTNGNQHRKHGDVGHIPGFGSGRCNGFGHKNFLLRNDEFCQKYSTVGTLLSTVFILLVYNQVFLPSPLRSW